MRLPIPALTLSLALILAACGGGAGETTTTSADTTTTTTVAETTTTEEAAGGEVIGIDEIPPECVEVFVDFLRLIEPVVEGVDWDNVSLEDLESLGTEFDQAIAGYQAEIEGLGCDQLNVDATDEESFQYMIDLARREAPGTVGYFEWIRDFTAPGGEEASGDCEADIAVMQAIIDEGATMDQLSMAELTEVSDLLASISTNCPAERAAEFMSRPSTQEFLGAGG